MRKTPRIRTLTRGMVHRMARFALFLGSIAFGSAACAQLLGSDQNPSFPADGVDASTDTAVQDGPGPLLPVPDDGDGGDDGGGVFERGDPLQTDGGTSTPAGTPGAWCAPVVNDGGYALCRDFDNDTDTPSGMLVYGTVTVIAGGGGKVLSVHPSTGVRAYAGYTAPLASRAVFAFDMAEVNSAACNAAVGTGVAEIWSGSARLGLAFTGGAYVAYYCGGNGYVCVKSSTLGTTDGNWSRIKFELSSQKARVSLLNSSGAEVDGRGWSSPSAIGQAFNVAVGLLDPGTSGDCNWLYDNVLLDIR